MSYAGGCLCGSVRYNVEAEPLDTVYCHCELCRRSSGALALAWVTFPVHQFSYTQGQPKSYSSSQHGQREFCDNCGTQIAFRSTRNPESLDVITGSLDDCNSDAVKPRSHIWYRNRVHWFDTTDTLPRYDRNNQLKLEDDDP